jgi:hypothetical protein
VTTLSQLAVRAGLSNVMHDELQSGAARLESAALRRRPSFR